MALITCKECNHEVSSKAVTCPNCGNPIKNVVKSDIKKGIALGLVVVAVGLGILGGFAYMISADSSESGGGSVSSENYNLVNVSIQRTSTSLIIENIDTQNWSEMKIYLNGSPPWCYKATFRAPVPGKTVIIPLSEFAKGSKRFDPRTQAADWLMIGGGGFDFRKYRF
jgi:hypothetical protein